jgi:hypothetical protein
VSSHQLPVLPELFFRTKQDLNNYNMLGLGLSLTKGGGVFLSAASKAAKAYQVRVLADSGTIEGYQCMVQKLTFLFNNP